jgi:ABC-type lipoprotein release transport system permease subunit
LWYVVVVVVAVVVLVVIVVVVVVVMMLSEGAYQHLRARAAGLPPHAAYRGRAAA